MLYLKINSYRITFSVLLLSLIILLPTSIWAGKYNHPPQYRIRTIVIDAGHGDNDIGARGRISVEKNLNLQIALKLGKAIEAELKDVKVYYTRTTDVLIDLYKRAEFANQKKADIYISVHCNSMPNITRRVVSRYKRNRKGKRTPVYKTTRMPNTTTSGTETFVSGYGRTGEQDVAIRENASILLEENYKNNYDGFDPNDPESVIVFSLMKNQFREQSIKLAAAVQHEYAKSHREDRGVKEQSLAVLARTGMPAILTEVGFISNPEEEIYLNSENGQQEIVNNIVNAVKSYKRQIEN
ncbi:N-acetylmuramoyl-L-alanine amidase [bacterium A37T11]|nr:N-acetylmuramoyl-L-alanine amidase [bacterium A37T11]